MADDQTLTVVKSEPLPPLSVVKSEPAEPSIGATIQKAFLGDKPFGATIEERLLGAGKRVARLGQQIGSIPAMVGLPTLAQGTDKLFGLPAGTSWQATEPTSPGQKQVGDYLTSLLTTIGTGAAGEALAPAGIAQTVGRASEDAGTTIQKAVDAASKAKASAPARILMRGHPLQAAAALTSRIAGSLSAKGLETFGQFLADDPDAGGKLVEIADKATSGGLTLNPAQGNFIVDVMNQASSGRALSGGQKAYINVIYRAMPK